MRSGIATVSLFVAFFIPCLVALLVASLVVTIIGRAVIVVVFTRESVLAVFLTCGIPFFVSLFVGFVGGWGRTMNRGCALKCIIRMARSFPCGTIIYAIIVRRRGFGRSAGRCWRRRKCRGVVIRSFLLARCRKDGEKDDGYGKRKERLHRGCLSNEFMKRRLCVTRETNIWRLQRLQIGAERKKNLQNRNVAYRSMVFAA